MSRQEAGMQEADMQAGMPLADQRSTAASAGQPRTELRGKKKDTMRTTFDDWQDGPGERQRPRPRRGFAGLDPERRREIARQGGRAAHAMGLAHEFTPEEARDARARSLRARNPAGDGGRDDAEAGKPGEQESGTL
jgi:general stress protein YciG